jgi:hypothetical protein
MKSIRFVCPLVIVGSVLVLAQFSRDQIANQPNGPPIAQEQHPGVPPNLSPMPRGVLFAQRGAGAFKATVSRLLPMSGLDFANAVIYGSGGSDAYSVAVADVNGDGKPDVIVANQCVSTTSCINSTVGVLLGNGDGTLQTAVTYGSGGSDATSVGVADVNGDGKPDLLVANLCASYGNCPTGGSISILLGNGDGTFHAAVVYSSGGVGTNSVAVGDVNGDGKPDLVVASDCLSSNCENGVVGVLLGNGDGTFQTAVTYASAGIDAYSVAMADVNGDGKPDLLVANLSNSNSAGGSVSVLLGNGDGTFQTAVTYDSGGYEALSLAVADVNGDGKPDLVAANACVNGNNCNNGAVGVLLGNGDGTFQTAVAYSSGGNDGGLVVGSVAVADVNGDGKPDLVVANQGNGNNGSVGVLLGNGDGTFQTAVTYGSGGYYATSVGVADVNGDGKPDLVVANRCANPGTNCGVSSSGTVGVLINTSISATITALTSSINPSNFGQAVTFTATVTAQGFYKGPPTGTVSFFDGTTNIGNSPLNGSGVATLTTSTLAVGTHRITATYNGDTNFAPSTSPVLHQIVQGAIVVLSPTHLNFGNETVGITSGPQFTVLSNSGNITLAIASIQVTGSNSSDFAEKNNCGTSVPPNGTCKITVTFTPSATGARNAAVSITDNAPNSPQALPLTGVGVLPAVTFSPTSLTFPVQLVFGSSPAKSVTLTNSGSGILLIRKFAVTGPFRQTNNCPRSIGPAANCTIKVKFHPTTKGVLHGSLSATDNAPGSPQKVPLTGTGTFVQFIPTKVKFGTQPVGTRSLPKKIVVTNQGDVSLNITKISITGTDAGDFAETSNCGKHLASGAHCVIKVTFKPLVKGTRTADVSVYDDGGGSPQKVGLTGTGT